MSPSRLPFRHTGLSIILYHNLCVIASILSVFDSKIYNNYFRRIEIVFLLNNSIMKLDVSYYILLFFIYSYIGWVCEVIYCAIEGKFINRGFVYGPVCPIYGFGAISLIVVFDLLNVSSMFSVFILGMILPTMLEYLTSLIMELIFKHRWWDYSRYRFNINGRVCLLNSTLFGIMALVLHFLFNPFFLSILSKLSSNTIFIICFSLSLFYAVDLIFTTLSLINIKIRKEDSRFYKTFTNRFNTFM